MTGCTRATPRHATSAVAYANSMLAFVLTRRDRLLVDVGDLKPGHPLYERIRAAVLADTSAWLAKRRGGALSTADATPAHHRRRPVCPIT